MFHKKLTYNLHYLERDINYLTSYIIALERALESLDIKLIDHYGLCSKRKEELEQESYVLVDTTSRYAIFKKRAK